MNEEPAPKRGLARNTANYGDRDFALYLRRSFAKSMGYSQAMLDRPVVGIVDTGSDFNNCHRTVPGTDRGGEARRAGGRRAAAGVPDGVAVRAVAVPDLDALPQPRRARHRGDADRAADGRRGAGRRLRQDRAGAVDGARRRPTFRRCNWSPARCWRRRSRASGCPPAPTAAATGRRIAPAASPPSASARSRGGWRPPPAPAA